MNDSPLLPGIALPTPEAVRDHKMQEGFQIIISEYGGDVNAFFKAHFKKQKESKEREASVRIDQMQQALIKKRMLVSI